LKNTNLIYGGSIVTDADSENIKYDKHILNDSEIKLNEETSEKKIKHGLYIKKQKNDLKSEVQILAKTTVLPSNLINNEEDKNSNLTKLKSDLELLTGIFIYYWKKLSPDENTNYPFEKGTLMHSFYVYVFPYMKFFSILLIVVVVYALIISLITFRWRNKSKHLLII